MEEGHKYQPDAPAREKPADPRWRVGLVSARARIFLAGVIVYRHKSEKRSTVDATVSEYLDFGILEYWIVDPQLHQVTVLVREGADWSEQIVSGEQTIPSAVLPGLTCHVAELWVGVSADESDA